VNIKKTGGWEGLTELIYNSTASLNGFDQYGHFGRTRVTLSGCVEYEVAAHGYSGCVARFNGTNAPETGEASTSTAELYRLLQEQMAERTGGTLSGEGPAIGVGQSDNTGGRQGEAGVAQSSKTEGTEPLLDY